MILIVRSMRRSIVEDPIAPVQTREMRENVQKKTGPFNCLTLTLSQNDFSAKIILPEAPKTSSRYPDLNFITDTSFEELSVSIKRQRSIVDRQGSRLWKVFFYTFFLGRNMDEEGQVVCSGRSFYPLF